MTTKDSNLTGVQQQAANVIRQMKKEGKTIARASVIAKNGSLLSEFIDALKEEGAKVSVDEDGDLEISIEQEEQDFIQSLKDERAEKERSIARDIEAISDVFNDIQDVDSDELTKLIGYSHISLIARDIELCAEWFKEFTAEIDTLKGIEHVTNASEGDTEQESPEGPSESETE